MQLHINCILQSKPLSQSDGSEALHDLTTRNHFDFTGVNLYGPPLDFIYPGLFYVWILMVKGLQNMIGDLYLLIKW